MQFEYEAAHVILCVLGQLDQSAQAVVENFPTVATHLLCCQLRCSPMQAEGEQLLADGVMKVSGNPVSLGGFSTIL